ncbi:DNA polymerase Y family protein [Catenuloplanes indicus]|uniref:Protein ImuB n=1 Tax=Catenuloplanes indicus TaxID=137267 RepID=A0AAE3VY46_9ACTN|nr:DNA polymerase Y family protein [Catenuloplanes indicus]MDQ0365876.1 protein ImuB [Catenuloplanes indicus]
MSGADTLRTLLLWCPDWPVVAAEIAEGVAVGGRVAVLRSNRVVACSEAARVDGVRRGLRKREAESRCPGLTVVEWDPARDARAFEPVVAAIEEKAAGIEVLRPGAAALAARGPARYFGGEERAAELIVEHVAASCEVEAQAGIADGTFAAGLAARRGVIVPPGGTPEFLAGLGVEALDRPQLTDMLRRLGIRTLGAFAALPASDVLARFGFDAALAQRLAAGGDHRPLAVRQPPPGLAVTDTYEEPLDRVDVAAFAARTLAERLHDRLAAHGLACTRLGITAVTERGEDLHRVWRHDGLLTTAALAERVRWQLDGWLTGTGRRPATGLRAAPPRPTSGIIRLTLTPEGILAHAGLQPGLWGETGEERRRAHRALSRVQGLLGPESVVTPVLAGGRSPSDAVTLIPWGDERTPARPGPLTPAPAATRRRSRKPPPQPIPESLLPQHPPPLSSPNAPASSPVAGDEPAAMPRATAAADIGQPNYRETASVFGEGLAEVVPLRRRTAAEPVAATEPVALTAVRPGAENAESGSGVSTAGARGGAVPAGTGSGAGPRRRAVRDRTRPGWPGSLPAPAPALVPVRPGRARVLDAAGEDVRVSGRLELSGEPARLLAEGDEPADIIGWAGPWPVDERWWAPAEAHRRVRFQVTLAGGAALLLSLAGGRWFVEARYD